MKNLYLALVLVAVGLGTQAHAKRLYGAAGCGLGNLVFKKHSQVLAATTNGTSYSQLFGITSGTSNCTDNGDLAQNRIPAFVESNRIALANDVARGEGDTLANLSKVMGCSDVNGVGQRLQGNYGRIFPTQDAAAEQISAQILSEIRSDSALKQSCKNVI